MMASKMAAAYAQNVVSDRRLYYYCWPRAFFSAIDLSVLNVPVQENIAAMSSRIAPFYNASRPVRSFSLKSEYLIFCHNY